MRNINESRKAPQGKIHQIYIAITRFHFEKRDQLNGEHPSYEEVTSRDTDWILLSEKMSIYHDNGRGRPELKFIHPSGREAVFDGDTLLPERDPRFKATYNYVTPVPMPYKKLDVMGWMRFMVKGFGHFVTDMLPYYLTGCKNERNQNNKGESEIVIGLVHVDTEELSVGNKHDFKDPRWDKYTVNDVLFIPYTRHNPFNTYDEAYHTYSLRLAVYKSADQNVKATINQIEMSADQGMIFKPLSTEVNRVVKFKSDDKKPDLADQEMMLVGFINDYDMKLDENSRLKVSINVTVDDGDAIVTEDLTYMLQTRVREYFVQP